MRLWFLSSGWMHRLPFSSFLPSLFTWEASSRRGLSLKISSPDLYSDVHQALLSEVSKQIILVFILMLPGLLSESVKEAKQLCEFWSEGRMIVIAVSHCLTLFGVWSTELWDRWRADLNICLNIIVWSADGMSFSHYTLIAFLSRGFSLLVWLWRSLILTRVGGARGKWVSFRCIKVRRR